MFVCANYTKGQPTLGLHAAANLYLKALATTIKMQQSDNHIVAKL